MTTTNILITGANRGLGLGILKRFLALPNHTIIALVRDPGHPSSVALSSLPKATGTTLIILKTEGTNWQDPLDAISQLETEHDIHHLDIVLANAGTGKIYPTVKDVLRKDIVEHIEINVFSAVALYQATRPLLEKAAKPVFAIMGSSAGALGRQANVPNAAYGAAKSMVHWYGVRINAEDGDWLISLVLDPGWVATDTGNYAGKLLGIGDAPGKVDESCDGMFQVLTTATKEKYGGKMVLWTGEVLDW
ncbi:hypothetical protein QBC35DRAFT_504310 [Podospora australis]|uniref:Aflatoxin biosynthesis ketoreductase nor-1 n=1 Tax=Podospora australis TaxID=1536484 RepID=A0AAN7AFC2_9PEZI|nr:hypothetical protein QBC35DRAFT_504310 [Podospora australis]